MDIPIALEGRGAYLVRAGRCQGQSGDGILQRPIQDGGTVAVLRSPDFGRVGIDGGEAVVYYNATRRHSSLNHIAPPAVHREHGGDSGGLNAQGYDDGGGPAVSHPQSARS